MSVEGEQCESIGGCERDGKRREPALHLFLDGPLPGLLVLGQRAELLHPDGRCDRHEGHGERVERRLDVPAGAVAGRGRVEPADGTRP